jgi:hypothetical protein
MSANAITLRIVPMLKKPVVRASQPGRVDAETVAAQLTSRQLTHCQSPSFRQLKMLATIA